MDKQSVIRMTVAVLGAVKLVLAAFGIEIPQEVIDAIANIAGAAFVVYAAWKNQYLSKKGRKQKEVLERNELL